MSEGLDFGFVGNAYTAPDPYQDSQRLINWYLEVSGDDKSKMATTLLGTPGLDPIISLAVVGAVRGSWVLPGGTSAIAVSGNTAYLITMTVPPTQTALAQFSNTSIGTLNTNSGQVCIRDNGAGGYAVLVDGQYGYYYRIAGVGTATITISTTIGSVVAVTQSPFPSSIIVGSNISDGGGFIAPGTTISDASPSALTIDLSLAALGTNAAVSATVTLASWGQITDSAFYGADRVAFIDGWLIFNKPGTQTFYTTAPYPYTLVFDGLFFALKDSSSDNLITHHELNRELWLVGERNSEIWFNAGGADFAFQRIPGAAPPIGCSAAQSIAQMGDSLAWLGKTGQGENVVIQTQQYTWRRISNHAIEAAIASYPLISDAFAYTYEDQGHLFYVLTFPTADATWVYDATTSEATGKPAWHERLSYDDVTGEFHRHRSNCFMNFQNIRMVGDYQSGQIHNMSRSYYTDAGEPLVALRRCPHLWSRENRQRLFHSSLQVEFAPGVGLATGQGSDPQAMLKWSDDGGANFGTEHWTTIGAIGRTKNRAIWRKLGQARDRVFEVRVSDPVKRDVVGATLYVAGSQQ